MALPTGPITLKGVATEFGNGSGKLSDFLRLDAVNGVYSNPENLGIPTAKPVRLSQFRGALREIAITITNTRTDYNLLADINAIYNPDPTTPLRVRLVIMATAVLGGVTTAGLTIGALPAGSYVTVETFGKIVGKSGAAGTATVGGAGGDALNANVAGIKIEILNKPGGEIRAGGGGGGNGGTGGGGSFNTTTDVGGAVGACPSTQSASQVCVSQYGAGRFCRVGATNANCGSQVPCCTDCTDMCWSPGVAPSCGTCSFTTTTNTSGGAGGDGGRGAGFASGAIVAAAAGLAGALGGTNAGRGGTGGAGGAYGVAGSTGATGANGNRTNGVAGSAGGAAGRAIVKTNVLAANWILTNNGTISGATV